MYKAIQLRSVTKSLLVTSLHLRRESVEEFTPAIRKQEQHLRLANLYNTTHSTAREIMRDSFVQMINRREGI